MGRKIYAEKTANYPRLKTDVFFADYENVYQYTGVIDKTIKFIEDFQLMDETLWKRFVRIFESYTDFDGGWRCEFWGKMMRGGCFIYSYTRNETLYRILTNTVRDIMQTQDEHGRISSYDTEHEFDAWDIWGRKYVLLGMQYYLEICRDEQFADEITACMQKQVDYIISKIGEEDGKKPITAATRHWRGLNSSSLLEPIVRLYSITGKKEYFDFATYIVECGGTDVENIFELAYRDELYPYQYPVTKAYEMTSCFEGLLEYYRITGIEKYKTAIIHFADKILESDFTIIGSCGCTHELFDHSTVRQANTTNGKIAQETCVTVTLMKFFYQLTLLTGDSKYADAFEISMYNAYLGAVNTEKVIEPTIKEEHSDWNIEPLPFDSYSPLTAGTRGNGVGGLKVMADKHYYGCCACIGAAGLGLVPKMTLLTAQEGFVLNLFIPGTIEAITPQNHKITLEIITDYPKTGNVQVVMHPETEEAFRLMIRRPAWSAENSVFVNGEKITQDAGYITVHRTWQDGDRVTIGMDMRTKAIYPISYGEQVLMNKVIWGHNYMVPTYDREDPIAKNHIALRRGPVILAQDNRLGYCMDEPVDVRVNTDGFVDAVLPEGRIAPYEHIVALEIPLTDGTNMTVTDYASAGKLWTEESKMAAWMLTK